MRRLIIILFAIAIHHGKCDEKTENLDCKSVKTKSTTLQLKEHLFCEYDWSVRPSLKEDDTTLVDVRMLPQYVEFSEDKNVIYLHTWLSLSWPDVHLTWEPSKWNNIKEIHVKSYEIWKPDLSVFNSGDMTDDDRGIGITDCLLTFNGTIQCIAPTKYASHCPTDYSEWPYDKHNCTLQIGAWMFYRNEILMKFETNGIMMDAFMENKQWNVHIDNKPPEFVSQFSEEGEITIFITVMLQRHGSRIAIVYILPAFVLMILTLIVLWLDSQSIERILVACINFICHILGLFDLHWYFPTSGSSTTPKILVFYETSIGLAAAALVLTCLLRKLRDTNVPAPMWMITGTTFILNSPIGTLLKLNVMEHKDAGILEEVENNDSIVTNRKDRTWKEFAAILEWLTFIIVLFIYLIMLAIILPRGPPNRLRPTYWL